MRTCLVIDDNEVNLEVAANMAKLLGFEVIKAESGMDALQPLTEGEVSVVLLDWRMPGLDGGDVIEFMRESRVGKKLPIIIYSGEDIGQPLRDVIDSGDVQGYIKKPITMDKLRTEFEKAGVL